MPIEVRCAGCGKLLRVADEHAGKTLRCPACNHISTAPPAGVAATLDVALSQPAWHMRTPEGQTYGPVAREQLDRWAVEGRLSSECQLSQSAAGPWEPATTLFPSLPQPQPKPHVRSPYEQLNVSESNVSQPSALATSALATSAPSASALPTSALPTSALPTSAPGGFFTPHRGGLILVLALVGIVMGCPIFSLMAWVMGSGDLREIRAGRMDPSGEGLTQAGQILGMIPSVLFILLAVGIMLIIIVAAVAGN